MPAFRDRGFEFAIDDACWRDAGMMGFTPDAPSFVPGAPEEGNSLEGLPVLLLRLDAIEATRRNLHGGHGVFRGPEPVKDLLRAFVASTPLPPVEVVRTSGRFRYRLHHGAHRFYCSVAAGFTHIPAIEVPEPSFEIE